MALLAVFAVFAGKEQRSLTFTPQKSCAHEFLGEKITAAAMSLPRCLEAKQARRRWAVARPGDESAWSEP
jgi:hypothetical protein